MSTIAALITEINDTFLTGGRRTTAAAVRTTMQDVLSSYLNIDSGGFVQNVPIGYSSEVSLTDDRSFPHIRYVKDAITAAVTGLWDDRGNYDASSNTYPATGGSGSGGAILKGDIWTASVAGTLGGTTVNIGDTIRALVDTPGQTIGNWALGKSTFGYTPLSNVLNDGYIFVGNASNVATGVSVSGDVSIDNTGLATVNNQWKIGGNNLSGTPQAIGSTDSTDVSFIRGGLAKITFEAGGVLFANTSLAQPNTGTLYYTATNGRILFGANNGSTSGGAAFSVYGSNGGSAIPGFPSPYLDGGVLVRQLYIPFSSAFDSFLLDKTGNLLLGTTINVSPSAKLHVYTFGSSGAAYAQKVTNSSFVDVLTLTENGNFFVSGKITLSADASSAMEAVTLQQLQAATVGLWDDRGTYDASSNLFPSTGGSGTAGAILKGDIWTISVAGTLGGSAVNIGDTVRALADSPGQTAANWALGESNLGYTPLSNVLNSAQFFVGNGSNVATGVTMSGDATLSNSGVLSISSNFVTLTGSQTLTNKNITASTNVLGGVTMSLGSDVNGDIYYRASSVLTRLGIGSSGQVLTVSGGLPVWATPSATISGSLATDQIAFGSASNTIAGTGNLTWVNGTSTLTIAGTTVLVGNIVGSASQNVFNTISTTINAYGAATAISMGAATGTFTFNNPTLVSSQATLTFFNTTSTTISFAGAATSLSMGAATGTFTVGNATATFTNAATVNINGANPTIAGSSTGTLTLFNTNLTTVNVFGAATAITLGATAGTLTLRNPTIVSSQATLTLFDSTTTTLTAGSAVTTATLFATTAASTFNIGTGATVNASTKTINLGTAGVSGSTTNVNIGSAVSGALGTLTFGFPTIVSANATLTIYNTTTTTITAYGAVTTATMYGTTATATFNLATGATVNAATKTINFGTAGVSGSTTAINIGSAVSGATTNITLNLASSATGDIWYRNSSGFMTRLGVGSNGQVLTLASGLPSWAAAGGGLTIGTTAITSGTAGRILFEGSGNVIQEDSNFLWDATNDRFSVGTTTSTAFINVVAASTTQASMRLLQTTTANIPTTPNTGDMYHQDVNGLIFVTGNSTNTLVQKISGTIFCQTNTVTIANTVTETTMVGTGTAPTNTKTLPANFGSIGGTIRIKMQGYYSTTGSPTGLLQVKLGTTQILTTFAQGMANNATNRLFEMEVLLTIRTTGATATVMGHGKVFTFSTSAILSTFTELTPNAGIGNTVTWDSTASKAIDVTWTWGTAAAGNTISIINTTYEIL